MPRDRRVHYGELDFELPEHFSVGIAARRKLSRAPTKIQLSEQQPASSAARVGEPSSETDLYEIEYYIETYRQELRELAEWIKEQDPAARNTKDVPIRGAFRELTKLQKSIGGDIVMLEQAVRRCDAAGAGLLGLRIASKMSKKRILSNFCNAISIGEKNRRDTKQGGDQKKESDQYKNYRSDLKEAAKSMVEKGMSYRSIAENLCRANKATGGRSVETVRKTLKEEFG